jgi:DNA-binding protein
MAQAIPDVTEESKQVRQDSRPAQQQTPSQAQQQLRPQSQQSPQPRIQQQQQMGGRMKRDDNVIYIGKKPTMSYVLAVMTQLQNNMTEIHVKARGRSISRAVDVVEVVRNRFVQDIKRDISIGTETINSKDRGSLNVSTIDIRMVR